MSDRQEYTVTTKQARQQWRAFGRDDVDGFDETHLYLHCTQERAQEIARATNATRLQRGHTHESKRPECLYCGNCGGSGNYSWGAVVNGKVTHTGTCFQCAGKGYQDDADQRRNYGYWNYKISAMHREDTRRAQSDDNEESA